MRWLAVYVLLGPYIAGFISVCCAFDSKKEPWALWLVGGPVLWFALLYGKFSSPTTTEGN